MDYFLRYEVGELDHDHPVTRTFLIKEENGVETRVNEIESGKFRTEKQEVEKKVKDPKTKKFNIEKVKEDVKVPITIPYNTGFGMNNTEAIKDFIRRNTSQVLDIIFTKK